MTQDPTPTTPVAAMPAVPPGFRPMPAGGDFMKVNGPLHIALDGERVLIGFRVESRHCNPMGNCHGGMLASFCDMLLPMSAHRKSEAVRNRFLPTISLQIDYLAPVVLGAWVQGEAEVLRVTRSLVFARGLVTSNGEPAVRVSGIFKLGPPFDPKAAHAAPAS